jgi:hypothetical protein
MQKDSKVIYENLKEEEKTLNVLLNMIIPSSVDGKLPSAADIGFVAYINKKNLFGLLQDGLRSIIDKSKTMYGQEFSSLCSYEKKQLIKKLRPMHLRFFKILTSEVIHFYYQHDNVLEALGLEARTPFPNGYSVEEGDLTLLEPVYHRGKIYRE